MRCRRPMLRSLAIRDIVLIERLELALRPGLSALTGETGAGKSIILDALGLALGGRGDRALVRAGRRAGLGHGRVRAGGARISQALLRGQRHPVRGRADPAPDRHRRRPQPRLRQRHRGEHGPAAPGGRPPGRGARAVRAARPAEPAGASRHPRRVRRAGRARGRRFARPMRAWRDAADRAGRARGELAAARREEDYLRHRARELADLAPTPGEEEELAQRAARADEPRQAGGSARRGAGRRRRRRRCMERLGAAERRLERSAGMAPELLEPAAGRSGPGAGRGRRGRGRAGDGAARAWRRAATRWRRSRSGCSRCATRRASTASPVDDAAGAPGRDAALLERIDAGAGGVEAAEREVEAARAAYRRGRGELSQRPRRGGWPAGRSGDGRAAAAEARARAGAGASSSPCPRRSGVRKGRERVAFEVSTNPGQPFGPIGKIASGGELSRFMLALKVVLARLDTDGHPDLRRGRRRHRRRHGGRGRRAPGAARRASGRCWS